MRRTKILTTSAALAMVASTGFTTAFASGPPTYTVQSGDTLYKISVKLGTSLSALEAANPQIQNVTYIYPGEIIQVPTTSTSAPNTASSSTSQAVPSSSPYTVQNGDTLYKIAVAHSVTLTTLEAANPQVTNFNSITPGQVLNMPTGQSPAEATSTSISVGTTQTQTTTSTGAPVQTASVPSTTTPTASTQPAANSTASSSKANAILSTAKSLLGTPYTWGGSTPSTGFDCSGFVQYVFAQNGIKLPRESHDQATVGTPVSQSNLVPGDLLFFANTDSYASLYANQVTHVGIYIGNGAMIESSDTHNGEGVVIIQNVFSNPYYVSHFYGARDDISGSAS